MVGRIPLEDDIGVRVPDWQLGATRVVAGRKQRVLLSSETRKAFENFLELCEQKSPKGVLLL